MKKKFFVFVFALLLACAFLWADDPLAYPWKIRGLIPATAILKAHLQTSYPQPLFDIDDSNFARYSDSLNGTALVKGICAGSYSLTCNDNMLNLYVSHTKLVNETDSKSEIDYRLDVFDSTGFKSVIAGEDPKKLDKESLSDSESEGPWGMTDKSFYVSLWWEGDNGDPRDSLAAGLYTSTIIFTLKKE